LHFIFEVHIVTTMKALIYAFFLSILGFLSGNAFLLKGFIEGGSLILEKADERFLDIVNTVLNKTHSGFAADGLKKLTSAAESTFSEAQNRGQSVASVLFAPLSEGNSSLLLSPVLLSESVVRDLADTGRSVLQLALPTENRESVQLPSTSIGDVINTISNFSLPISTSATREVLKNTIDNIPAEAVSIGSSVIKTFREAKPKA
jgi:hypothetical protein